jgi:hypothetical protein
MGSGSRVVRHVRADDRALLFPCVAAVRFFIGLHQPSDVRHVIAPAFVSVHRLKNRRSDFTGGADWILDSGAFSTIAMHAGYPEPVSVYAAEIRRVRSWGNLLAAVSQDWMCERVMLDRTGLTLEEHQQRTIDRYDALIAEDVGPYVMPVLQGYTAGSYRDHLQGYGARLAPGAWVGVGSVCKRNGNPRAIEEVLLAIKRERPDLRLHGFGLKKTALGSPLVWELLETADSMAWSYAARRNGRNGNDRREADAYVRALDANPRQLELVGAA